MTAETIVLDELRQFSGVVGIATTSQPGFSFKEVEDRLATSGNPDARAMPPDVLRSALNKLIDEGSVWSRISLCHGGVRLYGVMPASHRRKRE